MKPVRPHAAIRPDIACPLRSLVQGRSRPHFLKPVGYREQDQANRPPPTTSTTTGLVPGTYDAARDELPDVSHNIQFMANSYGTLSLLTSILGVTAFFFPVVTFGWMFGYTPTIEEVQLMRLLAGTSFISASVKNCLREEASGGLLSPDSPHIYRRLNLGLTLAAATSLLVLFQAEGFRTAAMTFTVGGLAGCTFLLAASEYASTKSGWPIPGIRAISSALFSLINPRNMTSALYSLVSIGFGGLALALSRAHVGGMPPFGLGVPLGAEGVFMCRLAAAFLLSAAIAAFTLKDAVDRATIGAGSYNTLNIGLAATSISLVTVLMGAVNAGTAAAGNQFWFPVIFGLATFLVTGYQYITSPTPASI